MKNIFKKILLSVFILPSLVFSIFFAFNPNIANAQCGVLLAGTDEWYTAGCHLDDPDLNPDSGGNNNNSSSGGGIGCTLNPDPKIQNVLNYMSCILNLSVVPLIFSLALVFFIYGVMQYVLNDADEGKKEKGKQFMVWGIIALTVMVSVWGLVNLLGGTFGIDTRVVPSVTPN